MTNLYLIQKYRDFRHGIRLCRQSRHLSRNQNFDLFKQKNKQTGSGGLKALKPAVFLVGNKFRLRIPVGKLVRFPNPSAL